mmetsp:Transcript_10554/g.32735  ORF Transcript_10554/g.32735 Transcript_10554/m.32735 type:complete len:251 (+) Transcript_10554:362-1114(+)
MISRSGYSLLNATTTRFVARLSATATTTNLAAPTPKYSRTSGLPRSPKNTGLPRCRASVALWGSKSKTTYLWSLASSNSHTTRPTRPYPTTTTNSPWAFFTALPTAASSLALRDRLSHAASSRSNGSAKRSPRAAKPGVRHILSAAAVVNSRAVEASSTLKALASPTATKPNSPAGANSSPVRAAAAAGSRKKSPSGTRAAAFAATRPSVAARAALGLAATTPKSTEKPTVAKNSPSNTPRNGATSASTW